MDYTKYISDFCYNLKYEDIPADTVKTIKYLIIDYLSAALAGYRTNKVFNCAAEKVMIGMGGKQESRVLFSDIRLPAENAAFLNAVYGHGADMDDGNRKAMGHVGAHVMPAVFALSDSLCSSKERIFEAIAVGYEVYCRISAAVAPGLVKRGFHSTGTAGAVACAAACAKLMGLDSEGIYNSMALATTQASGLLIVAESGQSCKPINPAKAAQSGIISAKMVSYGVKSFDNPLQSIKGWFHAMSDGVDYSMLEIKEGKFAVDECYFKPYPSCRHTHCTIEAASVLRSKYGFDICDINEVNVYIYQNAIDIAGQIKIPKTDDDSKFSIHYSLACALKNGSFTLDHLDSSEISEDIKDTVNKITLIPDPSMENRDKGIRGAKLQLVMKNGAVLENTVLIPKGDPENPFTLEDVTKKLKDCAGDIWSEEKQKRVVEGIMEL